MNLTLSPLFLIVIIAIVPFYVYAIFNIFVRNKRKLVYVLFFRMVTNIISDTDNDEKIISRIELDFKKLIEKYPMSIKEIETPLDFLEEMASIIDSMGIKKFNSHYGITIESESKNKIMDITEKIREKNPFISLSPKAANFLSSLKNSIELGNKELSYTTLKQLSDDIEEMESSMESQKKRFDRAHVIAVISVILSIVFGLLSFGHMLGLLPFAQQ
jgi:hypothetical protein